MLKSYTDMKLDIQMQQNSDLECSVRNTAKVSNQSAASPRISIPKTTYFDQDTRLNLPSACSLKQKANKSRHQVRERDTMKRSLEESVSSDDGQQPQQQGDAKRRKCPYLDTINHQMLDFDFEKVCSISLSDQNVYACLVCGKYFKGRGKATHAFTHSVQSAHHVFINLQNDRIYCLPDNYEVVDQCLRAIKNALRPTFEAAQVAKLDQNRILAQDAFGVSYLPGA